MPTSEQVLPRSACAVDRKDSIVIKGMPSGRIELRIGSLVSDTNTTTPGCFECKKSMASTARRSLYEPKLSPAEKRCGVKVLEWNSLSHSHAFVAEELKIQSKNARISLDLAVSNINLEQLMQKS
jgi:hypothetical protein